MRFNKVHEEDFLGWEAWLESMAREGFHATKVGRVFTRFEEGERKAVRYHVDLPGRAPRALRRDLLQEKGFHHVGNLGKNTIFRGGDPGTEEPDFLNQGKAVSYKRAAFRNRWMLRTALLLLVLFVASVTFLELGSRFLLYLVEEPVQGNALYVILFMGVLAFLSHRKLVACREAFETDSEARYKAEWEPPALSPALQNGILGILLVLIPVMGSITTGYGSRGLVEKAEAGELPVLLLQEVREDAGEDILMVREHGHLLAPAVVESVQRWQTEHLYTMYYDLVTEHLAKSIMEPLRRRAWMEEWAPRTVEGLDEFYLGIDGRLVTVLARRGRQVVLLTANMDMEESVLHARLLLLMDRGRSE